MSANKRNSFKKETSPKKIDCAIMFILDEEKNWFISKNNKFILSDESEDSFVEFFLWIKIII